ncbi:MAG: BF3164 family lipoprotein [Breznakibacter sp.]
MNKKTPKCFIETSSFIFNSFLFLFSIFVFRSCAGGINEGANFKHERNVNCVEVVGDLALRVPGDFGILDSLFVIQDPFANDFCFQIYNKKTGRPMFRGAKKGQGPLEMISSSNLSFSGKNILTYDYQLKRIINYTIGLVDSSLVPTVGNWGQFNNINKIQRIGEGKYLAISLTEKHMFSVIDSLKNTQTPFEGYPLDHPGVLSNFYDVFQGSIKTFNQGDAFVYAASNFPYFSIYTKSDNAYSKKYELFLSKPEFEVQNGKFSFKKESLAGFMGIAIGENSFFLLHSNVERYKSKQNRVDGIPKILYEFDFEGRPLCQYHLDKGVLRIACDKSGTVFGIALDGDEFKIVEIKI